MDDRRYLCESVRGQGIRQLRFEHLKIQWVRLGGNDGRSLLDLCAGFRDELRPAGDVFLDEGAEFLGRVADRLEAEAGHACSDLGVLHGGDEERVKLLDDG